MFIIIHSKEILNLTISFGILIIALLLAWLLFYIISIIKDLRAILKRTKDTIIATQETITAVKKKVDETSIQFKFLLESIKSMLDWIKDKRSDKNENSSHLAIKPEKTKNK